MTLSDLGNTGELIGAIALLEQLLFLHRNQGQAHEDSMTVISIEAKRNDYL